MAKDEINGHLRAIVENLRENRPVAGLVEVVAEEIRAVSLKDNIRRLGMSDLAGERRVNDTLYHAISELESISSDPHNAVYHAEEALRYWESVTKG